jgi:SAM-dependent methyltransferase
VRLRVRHALGAADRVSVREALETRYPSLPPVVRETLVAIAEREGELPEAALRYYGEEQPRARREQARRCARILDTPLSLATMPRLAEGLREVFALLGDDSVTLTGHATVTSLIAARPTVGALQAAALFGQSAPVLGVYEELRDDELDLRLSGFLVHEVCHGLARESREPPAPWTLIEAAALHLGYTARRAHFFPEVAGEALPAVAGFLLVGELFARRVSRRALWGLSLGESLADAIGAAPAARLIEEGLSVWRESRSTPFVLHALDALDWARRIEAAIHDLPLGPWGSLPWSDEAVSDADLAWIDTGVAALAGWHRGVPRLEVVPAEIGEVTVDVEASTFARRQRDDGVFGEPATWLLPPNVARVLAARGVRRERVPGAELVAWVEHKLRGRLCPLSDGAGWELARAAAWQAADELGLETTPLAITRRMRPLLDVLALGPRPPRLPLPRVGWGRLGEAMAADRPIEVDDASLGYHQHLGEVGSAPARELAARIPERGRVLDLGCGLGTYGAAFGGDDVWYFDRPDVLALGRGGTRVPGDLLAGDDEGAFAEGAAVVLLCNLLHLHGPRACARLVRRAAASLAEEGGVVVVKDFFVEPDRRGPRAGLVFALNMALYTAEGDVYPVPAIAEWLRAAGLTAIESFRLAADPEAIVVTGRRR